MTGEWRLGHQPALDGLRAVAVLLVLAYHSAATFTPHDQRPMGIVGVMVFFTLSGFLITALLLEERDDRGRVSFAGFYRRRALRLLPALFVFLAVGGAIYGALAGFSLAAFGSIVFYVANWAALSGVELGWLGHTWSLAVEEQFYLLWPVALALAARWRRGVLWLCGVGIVVSLALRALLWDGGAGGSRIYRGSDTEAFALLVGCLLAVLLHSGWLRPSRHRWPVWVALGVVFAVTVLPPTDAVAYLLVPVTVPVAAGVAIWAVADGSPGGWLGSTALRYVGRRSYALYLWHPITLLVGAMLAGGSVPGLAVGLLLTFAAAEASWRWVEAPFLRLKRSPVAADEAPSLRGRVDAR